MHVRIWLTGLAALLCGLSLPRNLDARQATPAVARVIGRVVDQESGRPISGAAIRIGGEARAISDENGWFSVTEAPPGAQQIAVEMLGYATRTENLTLRAGVAQQITITMAREAIALTPIEVTIRSDQLEAAGFYERERSGTGTMFNRAEIERRHTSLLTDLLRNVPGVRVYVLDPGRRHVRINRGANNSVPAFDPRQQLVLPGCEPDIYVDGQLYRERIPSDPTQNRVDDFDVVQVENIEGVEVYTGANAPLQYQSSCGVVLIWTRRGTPSPRVTVRESPAARTAAFTPGTLARITDRFGKKVTGRVGVVDADSVRVLQGDVTRSFAIAEVRRLEVDGGAASVPARAWRGAKWGFMIGVAAMAITAAGEEFSRGNGRDIGVSRSSPRDPAFAMTIIGATTLTGAFLGGTIWQYRRWDEVPFR
jgi:hypothetical protein